MQNDRDIMQHNYNYHFFKGTEKKKDVRQFENLLKPHTVFSYRGFLRWEIDLEGLRQAWGNIFKKGQTFC